MEKIKKFGRSGRDAVDHAGNAHDDLANAIAGALVLLAGKRNVAKPWVESLRIEPPTSNLFRGDY